MKDTFEKPPIHVAQEPSIGAPVIALGQRRPLRVPPDRPSDLPPWIPPLHLRLDTILRQQEEILYHLRHQWRVRWDRLVTWFRSRS